MGLVPEEICAFLGGQGVGEVLQVGGGDGTHTQSKGLTLQADWGWAS